MPTFTITTETGRVDKVLAGAYTEYTRSQLNQWLKNDLITVNDHSVRASYQVGPGDVIVITPPAPVPLDAVPQDIPIDIVYEDDDVIVVNKPQGMVVHPAPGHPDGTLVNGLLYHTKLAAINDVIRPGIVHRIDRDTSGLLMVAKSQAAMVSLSAQLRAKSNKREYLAIVHGNITAEKGTIDAPLARDPKDRKKIAIQAGGRNAITHYTVEERFGQYTLVRCILETGRTHQIRVHMSSIGHPLAGDPVYGPKKTLPGHGQFLHAAVLGFTQPTTGEELVFTAPVPPIFAQTLSDLRKGIDKARRIR